MHGADKSTQRQSTNSASGLISVGCAIHMGRPPDQYRTATRPTSQTGCGSQGESMGDTPDTRRSLTVVPLI
jgi:hypothetical protein